MGHNVGKAAEMAVSRSEKRNAKTAERTPEERLKNIRNLLASKLAVTPDDTRFLLELYDQTHALMVQGTALLQGATETIQELTKLNAKLTEENEQFRTVYEQENRRSEVKVEKFTGNAFGQPGTEEVKVATTVSTESKMPIEFPEVAAAVVEQA